VSNDLERRKGVDLARQFHEAHERLAPQFGYETRTETRAFDPESPNGRLMIAVCAEIAERAEADRDDALRMLDRAASYHAALLADREQLRAALAELVRANDAVAVLYEMSVIERDDNWDIDMREAEDALVAAWEPARALSEPQAKEGKHDA
jgi:hypothetical protein